MLKRVIDGRWLTANGVVAFYPANSVNHEDIEVYRDESRSDVLFTWRNLRQQTAKREGVDNKSLADYIAPKETGVADYIGVFAVTGGIGKIGRASCRARGCQYVEYSVVAVSLQKKKKQQHVNKGVFYLIKNIKIS